MLCRHRQLHHHFRRRAIAAYSFLGFDAVTTLTEETVEPRDRTVPRAIVLVALIGGGIFVAVST